MRELESKSGYLPDGSDLDVSGPPATTTERLPAGLASVDVVFPVLHGPYGEDGTIQGMLSSLAFLTSSGVLGSAAAMDKPTMKKIFAHHNLPQVRWVAMTSKQWEKNRDSWIGDRKLPRLPLLRKACQPWLERRYRQGRKHRRVG